MASLKGTIDSGELDAMRILALTGWEPDGPPSTTLKVWRMIRASVWAAWERRLEREVQAIENRPVGAPLGNYSLSIWPPHDARHDGIYGLALRRNYFHNPDANRETILLLALEGLGEVERTTSAVRASIPEAYVGRLRALVAYASGEFDDEEISAAASYRGIMMAGWLPDPA
jgi:hypothetical protein